MLLKISPFSFVVRLRNEEFYTFSQQTEKLMSQHGGASLFGADASAYTAFRKALKVYFDAIEDIRKNLLTPELAEADKKRDLAYTSWREQVRSAFKHPGTESFHRKAAVLQEIVDRYYRNHHGTPYNEETGVIRNLVQDFRAEPAAGYVTDLQLPVGWLNELAELNEAFDGLYLQRTREVAGKVRQDVPELRAVLRGALDDAISIVAAGALRETYKGQFVEFVNEMNVLISEYRVTLERRAGKSGKEDEGKADDGEPVGEAVSKLSAEAGAERDEVTEKVVIKEKVTKKQG
jgi:hypothetical protein